MPVSVLLQGRESTSVAAVWECLCLKGVLSSLQSRFFLDALEQSTTYERCSSLRYCAKITNKKINISNGLTFFHICKTYKIQTDSIPFILLITRYYTVSEPGIIILYYCIMCHAKSKFPFVALPQPTQPLQVYSSTLLTLFWNRQQILHICRYMQVCAPSCCCKTS